jgi:hypothetical protein
LIFAEMLDNCLAEMIKATPMKTRNKRIELNWGKLLGFSQVKVAQGELKSKAAKAMIGQVKTAGAKRIA